MHAGGDSTLDALRSEGDLNLSDERRRWIDHDLDDATRALLDEDARYFLHQSLSTPCLNATWSWIASYSAKTFPLFTETKSLKRTVPCFALRFQKSMVSPSKSTCVHGFQSP